MKSNIPVHLTYGQITVMSALAFDIWYIPLPGCSILKHSMRMSGYYFTLNSDKGIIIFE